jgi:hypothetical protein
MRQEIKRGAPSGWFRNSRTGCWLDLPKKCRRSAVGVSQEVVHVFGQVESQCRLPWGAEKGLSYSSGDREERMGPAHVCLRVGAVPYVVFEAATLPVSRQPAGPG